jgi:hypothetical protein
MIRPPKALPPSRVSQEWRILPTRGDGAATAPIREESAMVTLGKCPDCGKNIDGEPINQKVRLKEHRTDERDEKEFDSGICPGSGTVVPLAVAAGFVGSDW